MQTTQNKTALGCGCMSVIAGLLLIIVIGASIYLLNFALKPDNNKGRDYTRQYAAMKARYPWIKPWVDSLQNAKAIRDTFIIAQDGDRHHALYIYANPSEASKDSASPRAAVLIPGYTDCAVDMLHFGYIYNKVLGMNVLIPDLHANGKSDGTAMQMGWKDRKDVLQWIGIADSLFRGKAAHTRMVVHGVSMGAATAMNVSSEAPQIVRCYIEDCGYTSVWDEFSYELNDMFGLPDFPLLYSASALCKLKYGWSFGEASPLKQVAKCHKPMLFIHGGNDTYVPTHMVYPLYTAKPAPKYLVVFRGSAHAHSYLDHRWEYESTIKKFVDRYL